MKGNRFVRACFALSLFLCVACARRSTPQPTGSREGVFALGYEANTFRECGGSLTWAVEFAPGSEPQPWPKGTAGGFNATYYFVRWQADLSSPPRVPLGQPAATTPRARVRKVEQVRPLEHGECGEQF